MDCSNARLLLSFHRPGEVDVAEEAALAQHLDSCPDCASLAQVETLADRALASAMRAVPVPPNLRGKILQALARPRQPVRWPWIAAAACLFLALGLGAYLFFARPTLDFRDFVGQGPEKETEAASVERWFAGQGVNASLPREFNFAHLDYYDVQKVQGRRVPHLLFYFPGNNEQGPAIAHVYVFSEDSFRIDSVPNPFSTSSHNVTFRQGDGFLSVILFTGNSLAPFLRVNDM